VLHHQRMCVFEARNTLPEAKSHDMEHCVAHFQVRLGWLRCLIDVTASSPIPPRRHGNPQDVNSIRSALYSVSERRPLNESALADLAPQVRLKTPAEHQPGLSETLIQPELKQSSRCNGKVMSLDGDASAPERN
jgi:hypothetical protein